MPPGRNRRSRKDKQEPISGGAMADCVFPEDIMLCILKRLPVKSILRFESVCKPWCELFHTSEFIKMHRAHFSSDPKIQSAIIRENTRTTTTYVLNIIESTGKRTILDRPYPRSHNFDIVGCYNGLICVRGFDEEIVLWNPALKLYKFIRGSEEVDPDEEDDMVSLGFGYDADGDDFKVVRIVSVMNEISEMDKISGAEVYSADSDSWTIIELDFQFSVFSSCSHLIVNGNPYWVASVKDKDEVDVEVLVCFDVRKMAFMIVPLPAFNTGRVELVDWKGNLGALLCDKDVSGMFTSLDVWVYGEGIWRKIHTLGPIQGSVDRFTVCLKNGILLGKVSEERRSTKVIFRWNHLKFNHLKFSNTFSNGKMIVLDPDSGCAEEIVIEEGQNRLRPFSIYGYTESLTQVKGMVKEEDQDGEQEEDQDGEQEEDWDGVRALTTYL